MQTTSILSDFPQAIEYSHIYQHVQSHWDDVHRYAEGQLPVPFLLTCHFPRTDILQWIRCQAASPRVYWKSRDGQIEVGGYGSLITIQAQDPSQIQAAFQTISGITETHPHKSFLSFLGGMCFDSHHPQNSNWGAFPIMWFVVPHVYITRFTDQYYLTVGSMINNGAKIPEVSDILYHRLNTITRHDTNGSLRKLPKIIRRVDLPDYDGWKQNVRSALECIDNQSILKVVLARRTDIDFQDSFNPFDFLSQWKNKTNASYYFLFEPEPDSVFLGASPERLLALEKNKLYSEAVAGTVIRGYTPVEDMSYSETLSRSSKDLLEHRIVVDDLINKLSGLCSELDCPSHPEILKLPSVQHLVSRIAGELRQSTSVGELLALLHPTPAVSGIPNTAAKELIRTLEPFSRGWYAGPIGIISYANTEFAVGLRSLLMENASVSLYAGSGIVQGSTPESEWNETDAKLATAFKILSGKFE